LYAHLDQNLIPLLVGDTVTEGEVIGQLVDFPVTGFVHCHFARIVDEGFTWFGNWWTFDDPLFYMSNFRDTTAPVFTPFDNGELLRFKNPITSSFYPKNAIDWNENPDFIVKVHDQVNTDWQVDIHSTGYVLLKLNFEAGVWVEADTMQNVKSFDFNYFNDTYFSGPYIQTLISTMYNRDDSFFSSGNYQVRDFYHVLSNSNGDDTLDVQDAAVSLQTASLPSGKYRIKVWAKDAAGNISWANHDFSKGTVGLHHDGQQNFTAFPNPTDGSITLINQNSNCDFSLYDVTGRLIQSGELLKGINRLNLPPTAGLYLLHTQFGTVRILRKD
jgi:hypothetical protein